MKIYIIAVLLGIILSACSQSESLGPGYEFSLFKNTPNAALAKAAEDEDTNDINRILKGKGVNINYQEPQYGNTVLSLAVSNGKVKSVKALLDHGANFNILDSNHFAAIHEATNMIDLRRNVSQILSLLLQYGANANMPSDTANGYDILKFYLPLMGAVTNLECTRLLLSYKANFYYKIDEDYPVWTNLLIYDAPFDENIFVAKYLLIDKQMKMPDTIFYTMPDHKPVRALDLLKKFKVYDDPEKIKAKQEILDYLNKIGFPEHGAYTEK
ncbi:MAG: ankyrin repeat domain-containing protein [Arachidicoccus sp.]|nr:ankyrin repeat domain-containing protein [Arachidicoccus sp.]